MINGTYCLPCFGLLVVLVAAAKIHFAYQALVASTKQSRQVDNPGSVKRHSGLPGLLCALYLRLFFQVIFLPRKMA
jgi:hypothetical protein